MDLTKNNRKKTKCKKDWLCLYKPVFFINLFDKSIKSDITYLGGNMRKLSIKSFSTIFLIAFVLLVGIT